MAHHGMRDRCIAGFVRLVHLDVDFIKREFLNDDLYFYAPFCWHCFNDCELCNITVMDSVYTYQWMQLLWCRCRRYHSHSAIRPFSARDSRTIAAVITVCNCQRSFESGHEIPVLSLSWILFTPTKGTVIVLFDLHTSWNGKSDKQNETIFLSI